MVVAITVIAWIMPWLVDGGDAKQDCNDNLLLKAQEKGARDPEAWRMGLVYVLVYDMVIVGLMAALVVVTQMKWWLWSRHIMEARLYILAVWVISVLYQGMAQATWCHDTDKFAWRSLFLFQLVIMTWNVSLMWRRLAKLEESFRQDLGAHLLSWTVCWQVIVLAVTALLFGSTALIRLFAADVWIWNVLWRHNFFLSLFVVLFSSVILTWVANISCVTRAFWKVYQYSYYEAKRCPEGTEEAAMAWSAVKLARIHLIEVPLTLAPLVPALVLQFYEWFFPEGPFMIRACLHVFNMLGCSLCTRRIFVLSGLSSRMTMLTPARLKGDQASKVVHKDAGFPTGHAAWDEKVLELAHRGVTLRALLRFYRRLGSKGCMPHFDPAKHTTADVVRQAIIPLSAHGHNACRASKGASADHSMASVLMKGQPVLPQKLVTHTWSNLFADLVAAVVGDALRLPEYEGVRERLAPHNIAALEAELYWKGLHANTYWICCIAVDQHVSICRAVYESDIDPVTLQKHPACDCAAPKYRGDTLPVRADGRSIGCEMNKFDDMMRCLAAIQPGFSQLVAADEGLRLFNRAWCVAELHLAYTLGLEQRMCLKSVLGLHSQQQNLQELRVEEMMASNAQDRDMILASIPDKERFNAEIHKLIFEEGGLLQNYEDGLGLLVVLGGVARRGMLRSSSSMASGGEEPAEAQKEEAQLPLTDDEFVPSKPPAMTRKRCSVLMTALLVVVIAVLLFSFTHEQGCHGRMVDGACLTDDYIGVIPHPEVGGH